ESGVGIYKTTNGGNSWTKLPDSCVNNTTYSCANSGDAFLGRGINQIAIDPTNPKHLFVGSALGVRGLSHTVGVGTTESQRFEPGANPVGVYESTAGGATFTEVWNGNNPNSFGRPERAAVHDCWSAGLQGLAEALVEHDGKPVLCDDQFLYRRVLVRRGRLHAGRIARHGLCDRLV